jgi:hypothetical protein
MSSLQSYSAFPAGGGSNYASPSQLPEILLYNTTLTNGTASLTLSNTAFTFSTYNRIHVRLTGVTFAASASPTGWWYGIQGMKSNANITGTHGYTYEGNTSATATGWASSTTPITTTPFPLLQVNGSGVSKTSYTPQLDIYIDKWGIEMLELSIDSLGTSPMYHKRGYLTFPSGSIATTTDYAGLILNLQGGAGSGLTWAGGNVNVYGVK